eukprot:14289342-Alexandrium_andersonii.AAC.1
MGYCRAACTINAEAGSSDDPAEPNSSSSLTTLESPSIRWHSRKAGGAAGAALPTLSMLNRDER